MNLYEVTIRLGRDFKIVGRVEATDVNVARDYARKYVNQHLSRGLFSCSLVRSNSDKRYQVEQVFEDLQAGAAPVVTRLPKIYKTREATHEKARNLCWSTQPHGVDKPLSRSTGKVVEVDA